MRIAITLVVLLTVASASAQDWELWPDKTALPPGETLFGLPIEPGGDEISTTSSESPDAWLDIGLGETRERDGLQYKALQFARDVDHEVRNVPTGSYLIGVLGQFYPTDTLDPVETMRGMNLVQVELDGTVVPIDDSWIARTEDFPFPGFVLGAYNVFPTFHTPGVHTYVQTYAQTEPVFVQIPMEQLAEAFGQVDPSPEFEGRRVYLPEQVGETVDGRIEIRSTLHVVDAATAVADASWGLVKQDVASE